MPSLTQEQVNQRVGRLQEYLIKAIEEPLIILATHARSYRMRFYSAANAERDKILQYAFKNHLTILARKGRVILGPKDFDTYLDFKFDLNMCSQEELKEEFNKSYPKNLLYDVRKEKELTRQAQIEMPRTRSINELKAIGDEALRNMGFGKKKEEKEIIDPYAADENATKDEE